MQRPNKHNGSKFWVMAFENWPTLWALEIVAFTTLIAVAAVQHVSCAIALTASATRMARWVTPDPACQGSRPAAHRTHRGVPRPEPLPAWLGADP